MADDKLAAAVEKIKHHHRQHVSVNFSAPGICVSRCSEPWPCEAYRAAAALDAVLKQHQPGRITLFGALCKRHESHRHFSITSTEAADVRACQDCAATVYNSCTGCGPQVNVDLCPTRNAVTRTLTGGVDDAAT